MTRAAVLPGSGWYLSRGMLPSGCAGGEGRPRSCQPCVRRHRREGQRRLPQAQLSGDGRFVAFVSAASNVHPDDSDGIPDVFVRDPQTGTTTLVSRANGPAGVKANGSARRSSSGGAGTTHAAGAGTSAARFVIAGAARVSVWTLAARPTLVRPTRDPRGSLRWARSCRSRSSPNG